MIAEIGSVSDKVLNMSSTLPIGPPVGSADDRVFANLYALIPFINSQLSHEEMVVAALSTYTLALRTSDVFWESEYESYTYNSTEGRIIESNRTWDARSQVTSVLDKVTPYLEGLLNVAPCTSPKANFVFCLASGAKPDDDICVAQPVNSNRTCAYFPEACYFSLEKTGQDDLNQQCCFGSIYHRDTHSCECIGGTGPQCYTGPPMPSPSPSPEPSQEPWPSSSAIPSPEPIPSATVNPSASPVAGEFRFHARAYTKMPLNR